VDAVRNLRFNPEISSSTLVHPVAARGEAGSARFRRARHDPDALFLSQ
jgi:hypothetical protein